MRIIKLGLPDTFRPNPLHNMLIYFNNDYTKSPGQFNFFWMGSPICAIRFWTVFFWHLNLLRELLRPCTTNQPELFNFTNLTVLAARVYWCWWSAMSSSSHVLYPLDLLHSVPSPHFLYASRSWANSPLVLADPPPCGNTGRHPP